ncbi:MAG: Flp pilus assembly complex ATPase component TadA [Verrucomicrobia bacterium]|nr:Flp pilus assembly complex ATPase component TadA [Verrucomicrobiota bacterium]MCH8511003.1 Flp pilus assembly complex ATPase component TadA [Kiritimatiellia bacterium]
MVETVTDKLFDALVRRYELSEDQLDEAASKAEAEDLTLEESLIALDMIPTEAISIALAESADTVPFELSLLKLDPLLLADLPIQQMKRHQILPISRIGKTLTVAIADPYNVIALEAISGASGLKLMTVVVPEKILETAVDQLLTESEKGGDLEETLEQFNADAELSTVTGGRDNYDMDEMAQSADGKPVIRIVNSVFVEALRTRASDIHIEPDLDTCRVRYRVDGVLIESGNPPKSLMNAIVSRIKIMSNLDIAERRVPQDGRCRIRALDKEVDIRVSILPVIHGEKIVMRILDKTNLPKGLGDLGLDDYSKNAFGRALAQPYGMIFVTGPTGSGKTTTLYSALQELNDPETNIVTVEDPVEYQLSGINQVQTHAEVGLTFAAGLRSILRQDPDIVLVGEVRDFETASIAVQAALTGHLVLSTLHTNDAPGAVARLHNMGLEPFMLASALILAQAQRLYRRLCPNCKTAAKITMDDLRANHFRLDDLDFQEKEIFVAGKCPKCNQLGFKGRGGIMEIMEISEPIREMIMKGANGDDLRRTAVQQGMITLQRAGLNKVFDGLTTIDEVLRITSSA